MYRRQLIEVCASVPEAHTALECTGMGCSGTRTRGGNWAREDQAQRGIVPGTKPVRAHGPTPQTFECVHLPPCRVPD